MKMKLFVWTDVLCDYSEGMAVAMAPDLETALLLMQKKAAYDLELPISKCKIVEVETEAEPFAEYVYGGG